MITEWLVSLAMSVAGWVGTLFGEWEDEAVFDSFTSMAADAMAGFAGLGVWVDWGVLGTCVAVQMGVTLTVLGIKLIRAVAAHIPLFGGSGD